MKNVLIISMLFVCFTLVGCTSNYRSDYKSAVIFGYVDACVKAGGPAQICACQMDYIMKKVPYSKFVEWDTSLTLNPKGKLPDEFVKVLSETREKCE